MSQIILYSLGTFLLLAGVVLALILYRLIKNQVQSPQHKLRKQRAIAKSSIRQPYNAARSRLLSLVNGDMSTAQRLVANIKNSYPQRTEEWCWEKAADDLIRDRS